MSLMDTNGTNRTHILSMYMTPRVTVVCWRPYLASTMDLWLQALDYQVSCTQIWAPSRHSINLLSHQKWRVSCTHIPFRVTSPFVIWIHLVRTSFQKKIHLTPPGSSKWRQTSGKQRSCGHCGIQHYTRYTVYSKLLRANKELVSPTSEH